MQVLPDNQVLHLEKIYQCCDGTDEQQDIAFSLQEGTRTCTLTLEEAMRKIAREFCHVAKLVPPGAAIVVSFKAFRPWSPEEIASRKK